jgi:DIRP
MTSCRFLKTRYKEYEWSYVAMQTVDRLTRQQRQATRRQIQKRPRRFSKKFIQSQLNQRNLHRNNVRMIQRNPHLAYSSRLPYDIPAPISIGSIVNAYCKAHKVVQTGTVLGFDSVNAMYTIQFRNKHFGCEFCPDTDVASVGSRCLLYKASHNEISDDPNANAPGHSHSLRSLPVAGTSTSTQSLAERIAEREAFLVMLNTIEQAMRLKADILSILDDATTMMMKGHHPPNINDTTGTSTCIKHNLSTPAREHIDWLLSNLGRVNIIIKTATHHLQTLYVQPIQHKK